MPPDEPNDEERLEKLPEDGDTPAALPTPGRDPADENLDREVLGTKSTKNYPQQDDEVDDFQELYDEGAEVEEPNAGNSVEGYDPDKDQRRQAGR